MFVQLVIAAITTDPWRTGPRSVISEFSSGSTARSVLTTGSTGPVCPPPSSRKSETSSSGASGSRRSRKASTNEVHAPDSGTRSWGRFGPAS